MKRHRSHALGYGLTALMTGLVLTTSGDAQDGSSWPGPAVRRAPRREMRVAAWTDASAISPDPRPGGPAPAPTTIDAPQELLDAGAGEGLERDSLEPAASTGQAASTWPVSAQDPAAGGATAAGGGEASGDSEAANGLGAGGAAAGDSGNVEALDWWEAEILRSLGHAPEAQAVSVEDLLIRALQYSARISLASDIPLVREQAITEADAAFDWKSFVNTRWDDLSEPVGNTLTTGGPPRFRDENWNATAGLRRKNIAGGEFEVSQRLGYQNTNSVFFIPRDQGTTRLTLSYTQPLLRGAGRMVNSSLTVLAQVNAEIGMDEFSRQLQDRLLEVTQSYWGLYLERGAYFQKKRLYERAASILEELEHRSSLGTLKSQLVRAKAAVEARQSDLLRAEMAIKNAESRIRALVNDPRLGDSVSMELVPLESPLRQEVPVDMVTSVSMALRSRPEILQAMREVKASGVRLNVAENELLPVLNVVLQTYASGLRGDFDLEDAFLDQFRTGEPSYGVGLQYEMPIWNRAAQARYRQRRIEIRQLQNQFRDTAEQIKQEVEVAVRELDTSYRELAMKRRALEASRSEVDYIYERWRVLPEEEGSASLFLENLLGAQERLAEAEFEYLSSGVSLSLAQMNYKRVLGVLLQAEQINVARGCECNVPAHILDKLSTRAGDPALQSLPPQVPSLELETLPLDGSMGPLAAPPSAAMSAPQSPAGRSAPVAPPYGPAAQAPAGQAGRSLSVSPHGPQLPPFPPAAAARTSRPAGPR